MNTSEKVVIWGASGHAKVVAEILRTTGYDIAGFIDGLQPDRRGESFCGGVVLGGAEQMAELLAKNVSRAIVGFGNNSRRLEMAMLLQSRGFKLITAIHRSAIISSSAEIGCGTVIAAGAVLNADARIGVNVIVNTHATVEHDCIIGDGAHIAPGVNLAGGVRVGRAALLGIGSTVLEKRQIGENSIVGAGAVVLEDVAAGTVVAGVPARVIKEVR